MLFSEISILIKSIIPAFVLILQSHNRRAPAQVLAAVLLDGGDAEQGGGPPALQQEVPEV